MKLKGKTAVITGGGSGIGRAIAAVFAQHGASVCLIDINREAMEEVCTQIRQDGGACQCYVADVCEQAQVSKTVGQIGPIDILVNNAGVAHVGNIEHCQPGDFDRVFDVNVKGAYHVLYAVIPVMKSAGGGVVLNLASIASSVGIADRFAYSMSKGAIHAMSMSIARDYLRHHIRSNSISPARVHTPLLMGLLLRTTRIINKKCSNSSRPHNPLVEWRNRRK